MGSSPTIPILPIYRWQLNKSRIRRDAAGQIRAQKNPVTHDANGELAGNREEGLGLVGFEPTANEL